MKKVYRILYENYGINGEDPEGITIEVDVVAGSMEKAIRKLRSSLPKSLEYNITIVEESESEVIL